MNEQRKIKYGSGDVDKKNSEGYSDPTVYEALTNIQREERTFKPLVISAPRIQVIPREIPRRLRLIAVSP